MLSLFKPAWTVTFVLINVIDCLQWDQISMDVFEVLNNCDPGQVCPQKYPFDQSCLLVGRVRSNFTSRPLGGGVMQHAEFS